jgi:virulence factor Mce-like protein
MTARSQHSLAGSPILVGAATVLCAVVAVFLSYNANNGLPFVPTYDLTVQVPDAAGLVRGNEVRIGGKRVGAIERIEATFTPKGGVISTLHVALITKLEPLPVDSEVTVRPRSPLGLKYLELRPGHATKGIGAGGTLPLSAAQPIVELDEVVNAFDSSSRRALRDMLGELGPAFAGRGAGVNDLLSESPALLTGVEHVASNVSAPRTRLDRFVRSADAFTGELAAASTEAASAAAGADTTAGAFDAARPWLDEVLAETPPTEAAALSALREARPLLTDAAALARDVRPAIRLLPETSAELDRSLDAGTPVLRRAVGLADRLEEALRAVAVLTEDPVTGRVLERLLRALQSARPTLEYIAPAQTKCNYLGLWTRNVTETISEGDASGTWFRTLVVGGVDESRASAEPAPNLHVNPYPNAAAPGQGGECEAGNEPYLAGRRIGNVPGNQGRSTERTEPPAGVGRP